MPLGRPKIFLSADQQRAVPMVPDPAAGISPDLCLNPFLPFSRMLLVPLQRRSGWSECGTSSSSCPLLTTGQCCPQPAELSPAALQRAMVRFQALSHVSNTMPGYVEAVEGCTGLIYRVNLLGQFLGTGVGLVQLMAVAVLCWCWVLQRGTWSSWIYFIFSISSSNNN